jgi:hypothetical protein
MKLDYNCLKIDHYSNFQKPKCSQIEPIAYKKKYCRTGANSRKQNYRINEIIGDLNVFIPTILVYAI